MSNFSVIDGPGKPIKAWINGVSVEEDAKQQLRNIAQMPFIHKHVAVMPDVHLGKGATVGTVIATDKALIPAAVGVDIGCGMQAIRLSITASQLPDSLSSIRASIEQAIPMGAGGSHANWGHTKLKGYERIFDKLGYTDKEYKKAVSQIGTLGSGNHFVEVCLDENQNVWIMLHSGSRGIGNMIGQRYIELAKREMERWMIHLPDKDLAYLTEGSTHFDDYVEAVSWAQDYALHNRQAMMRLVLSALSKENFSRFEVTEEAISCHHNYVEKENHYEKNVWVTRKGAVRARDGDLGIIPGSMGAKSFIVRGKGNKESFCSCSHGAGRSMSRTEAKRRFSVQDHVEATKGVECRKDESVIDETPAAYKDIEAVMNAQTDLVDIVHTLKQVMCVKG